MITEPSPESPSALLERAAALIEQRAAAIPAFGGMHGIEGNEAWTEWLATFMDPDPEAVASPLVEWLRAVASYIGNGQRLNDADRAAVRFARTILGEPVDPR